MEQGGKIVAYIGALAYVVFAEGPRRSKGTDETSARPRVRDDLEPFRVRPVQPHDGSGRPSREALS